MGDNDGVVDEEFSPTPFDDNLPPTLLWTSPLVDRFVGVWVDDGDGREGFGIKLSARLLFHAGTGWVSFSTGSMHHMG